MPSCSCPGRSGRVTWTRIFSTTSYSVISAIGFSLDAHLGHESTSMPMLCFISVALDPITEKRVKNRRKADTKSHIVKTSAAGRIRVSVSPRCVFLGKNVRTWSWRIPFHATTAAIAESVRTLERAQVPYFASQAVPIALASRNLATCSISLTMIGCFTAPISKTTRGGS